MPLALGLSSAPVAAQWTAGGVRLCQSGCTGGLPRTLAGRSVVSDGSGGAYVVWRISSPTTAQDIYLQRITATGLIAAGWPVEGLPIAALDSEQGSANLAGDGEGGVLIVWRDARSGSDGYDVYAQRVLANGSIAPGWPLNGAPVSRAHRSQDLPAIAPDGNGGAYVAWYDERDYNANAQDAYAQHLTAGGTVAAGWPENGLPVCVDPAGQVPWSVVPDGSGGAVVVWADGRNGTLATYAQRLLADGTIAPGWVPNGVLVIGQVTRGGAVADGAGGFYAAAASLDPVYFDDKEYFVQRFTFAGTRAPGWPEGGLRVCGAPQLRTALRISQDGVGGALLTWWDERVSLEIYASRVVPEGTVASGWAADGALVSDPSPTYAEFDSDIDHDGGGGAYVVWRREDSTGDPNFVQHVTAGGVVAPGWPAYGVRLSPSDSQYDPRITSDGRGGAIVAWDEQQSRSGVWAQRFVMDGVVAAQVSLASVQALPDEVRLVWHTSEAISFHATVERRREITEWRPVGRVDADGAGRIEYRDREVAAGERYAYRLAYTDEGTERYTAEAWVGVPRALTLALEGLRPNPAVRDLNLSFTLPSAAPARLEILDAGGRRVVEREVGSLGPGRHLFALGAGSRLAPGMYWIRITQAGSSILARGAVIR